MTYILLIRMLQQKGWQIKNQEDSHVHLIHASIPGQELIITNPGNKEFPPGTLKSILKQAGLE
ncbi:type II toxin-antitoxin system HicA family toxin [Chitinophaga defluvii]|uniref:Type II toxin-antitoxin system HicA family toxin n=1 Tax=Chitinophaga defluvii TaxID=3163343 RepID=A0ABV2TAW6_9BACT